MPVRRFSRSARSSNHRWTASYSSTTASRSGSYPRATTGPSPTAALGSGASAAASSSRRAAAASRSGRSSIDASGESASGLDPPASADGSGSSVAGSGGSLSLPAAGSEPSSTHASRPGVSSFVAVPGSVSAASTSVSAASGPRPPSGAVASGSAAGSRPTTRARSGTTDSVSRTAARSRGSALPLVARAASRSRSYTPSRWSRTRRRSIAAAVSAATADCRVESVSRSRVGRVSHSFRRRPPGLVTVWSTTSNSAGPSPVMGSVTSRLRCVVASSPTLSSPDSGWRRVIEASTPVPVSST